MKIKVYVWFDCKTESFGVPMFQDHRGNAYRMFKELVNKRVRQPGDYISQYPADYTFFEIGEYDLSTGVMVMYEAKINLGTGLEYKDDESVPPTMATVPA